MSQPPNLIMMLTTLALAAGLDSRTPEEKRAAREEADKRRATKAAEVKAAYEAAAAPFREERARRKREAWLKRQPKVAK